MKKNAPRPILILDYQVYFGIEPPSNRLSLLKGYSKEHILYEIAALNYRLKPKEKIEIDKSLDTQVNELKYFTKNETLFKEYSVVADKFTYSEKNYPIIFNRQACLFALEEIIHSDEMQTDEKFVMSLEVWDSILKYLLAVNYAITQIKSEKDDSVINFETLNPKLLFLNELTIETDQILIPYRGYKLFEFLMKNPDLSSEIESYFKENYGFDSLQFIFQIIALYMANVGAKKEFEFLFIVEAGHQEIFEKLSKIIPNKNLETHKLLNVRKYPFIKAGDSRYLIADNSFLVEKVYYQFINDFWFDKIKNIKDSEGKSKFSIKHYRGVFGNFFENYIADIIKNSFKNYHYSKLLMFEELKININKKEIEICDIYLRHNKKILLIQVKSGTIYDNEKFGGNTETLYKKDRVNFFKNFGVNQLLESINMMDENSYQNFKKKYKK